MKYKPHKNQVRKARVVSEAWLSIKDDKEWAQVCKHLDLGLPLAFCFAQGICPISEEGIGYVEDAYTMLLQSFGIDPSEKFKSWVEVIEHVLEEEARGREHGEVFFCSGR